MILVRYKRLFFHPAHLAVAYGILAVLSTVLFSLAEGSLWDARTVLINDKKLVNLPLFSNISTILDFLLLNPIVIYFLISARNASIAVTREYKRAPLLSTYHQFGLLVLVVTLATKAMLFYLNGFVSGQNFDAIVSISSYGDIGITKTGWVVFFWTVVFMSILFYCIAENVAYAIFLLSLRENEIKYFPFHPDESGGLVYLIWPSIAFLRAMGVLLITFLLFYIYDFMLHRITESVRVFGFAVYLAIVIPVFFLPLMHIHRLMKIQKQQIVSQYISSINHQYSPTQRIQSSGKTIGISEIVDTMTILEKYKKLIDQLPVWPMPIRSLPEQLLGLFAAIAPIVQKLLPLILHKTLI